MEDNKLIKSKNNILIIAGIIILVIVFSFIIFYNYYITINKQIDSFKEQENIYIELIKENIANRISTLINKPLIYLEKSINDEDNTPKLEEVFKYNKLQEIKSIFLINKQDSSIIIKDYINQYSDKQNLNNFIPELKNISKNNWNRLNNINQNYYIAPFHITKDYQLMLVYYPIQTEDKVKDVIVSVSDLSILTKKYIGKIKIGKYGSGGIIDGHGYVLYDREKEIIGKNIFNLHKEYPEILKLDKKIINNTKGENSYKFLVREEKKIYKKYVSWDTVQIGANRIIIAIFTPEEDLIGSFKGFKNKIVLLGMLLIIILIIFGIMFFRLNNKSLINTANVLRNKYEQKTKKLKDNKDELQRMNKKLNNIFKFGDIVFWSVDMENNKLMDISGSVKKLYGYSINSFYNDPLLLKKVIYPEDKRRIKHKKNILFDNNKHDVINCVYRIRKKDGKIHWVKDITIAIRSNNELIRMDGLLFDITQRKKAEIKLVNEKTRLEKILQTTQDGYWMVNSKGYIIDVNQAYINMVGYSRNELMGMEISKLDVKENKKETKNHIKKVRDKGHVLFETKHKTKTGKIIDVEISTSFVKSKKPFFVVFIRDITERKREEDKIRYLSFHDKMTGLFNRRYFENELERLNKSRKVPISIVIGDMDGLKFINDNYGHKVGDKYIKESANVFNAITRSGDIVARIGGDEFAIILPETTLDTAKHLCERIKNKLNQVNDTNRLSEPLSISLGYATKEKLEEDLNNVFDKADKKMYKNKKATPFLPKTKVDGRN